MANGEFLFQTVEIEIENLIIQLLISIIINLETDE